MTDSKLTWRHQCSHCVSQLFNQNNGQGDWYQKKKKKPNKQTNKQTNKKKKKTKTKKKKKKTNKQKNSNLMTIK